MNGGAVRDNFSLNEGGGVYVDEASFVMNGGQLLCNSATYRGGGVYIKNGSFDKKAGAKIYGKGMSFYENVAYVSEPDPFFPGHAAFAYYTDINRPTLTEFLYRDTDSDWESRLFCNSIRDCSRIQEFDEEEEGPDTWGYFGMI
jgi:hypothetical protein